jgi:hypothetical protein
MTPTHATNLRHLAIPALSHNVFWLVGMRSMNAITGAGPGCRTTPQAAWQTSSTTHCSNGSIACSLPGSDMIARGGSLPG